MRRLALALLLSADAIYGCSCAHLTECELARAPVIFIGKVVAGGVGSLRDDPWYKDSKSVRFQVIEAMRGLAPDTKFVDMEIRLWPGMCSPNPYRPGRTYLVAPSSQSGKLSDGVCFSGRDVETASDTVEYLRGHLKNPSRSYIRGRVGAVDASNHDLVDFLLRQGEGKPLAGVRVWTSKNGKTFSAASDEGGRYELEVPAPGPYTVHAELAPYADGSATVSVPLGAPCAVRDVGLLSNSSISGKVWDQRGELLKHARVGLIDLDRPADDKTKAWFREAYPERPDGSFLFKNVPPGRYLLAFNPDGPQADGYKPLPFESSFYPNGARRAQAQMLEVHYSGVNLVGRDLIAGPPVTFRNVTVKVLFPDGTPMTSSSITVIGEPLETGGIPWYGRGFISEKQAEARFQVPANRKIRISARDWYGRDLPKILESTHLPGLMPITREFIVDAP